MAWAAALLGTEDITIVLTESILETHMVHIANEIPDMHIREIHPIIY